MHEDVPASAAFSVPLTKGKIPESKARKLSAREARAVFLVYIYIYIYIICVLCDIICNNYILYNIRLYA